MADTVSRYEISVVTEAGEQYSDVLYFISFRNPIIKNASFSLIRINMSVIQFQVLQKEISKNKFPKIKLMIYMVDEINKRTKFIGYRPYLIISISAMEKIDMSKPEAHVQLLLLNPVIHQMEIALSYNKILENIKAYDAILDFEEHIKKTYGDCFQKCHIGFDEKYRNEYKYEQILTFTKSDLNVPSFIIDCFKPTTVSPFYFFDDFSLSPNSEKDIVCVFINPIDKEKFSKFDLSQYPDIEYGTIKLGKYDFIDPFFEGIKDSESAVIHDRENVIDLKKIKTSTPIQQKTIGSNLEDFEGGYKGRGVKFTAHNIINKSVKQSIQYQNIYAPDDKDNAKKRIEDYRKLIKEKIDRIEIFETRRCLLDWLQFGRIYNLIKDNRSAYIYTPISITNIFTRENEKEFYLRHSARYAMIKFFE